jgi:hypothetical protein
MTAVAIVDWLERFTGAFTAVDLALLVAAGLLVWWVVASLWATVNLGPIEVTTFTYDGEEAPPVNELTARFRELLDKVGIPPPSAVPSGSPQADVVQAIEASPLPQGAFIAKLMDVLPTPPRPMAFRVVGTLVGIPTPAPASALVAVGAPPPPPPPAAALMPCGVSVWLQPVGPGSSLLKTVDKRATHTAAIDDAANAIYLHLANSAPDVFPVWARWPSREALDAYSTGCDYRRQARATAALPSLDAMLALSRASELAPLNALARLELGNLEELTGGIVADQHLTGLLQASALRRYVEVGDEYPDLLEARFRASVTAVALARSCTALAGEPAQLETIQNAYGHDAGPVDTLAERLRETARGELKATVRLVRMPHTLLHEQRLRNPFEWRGAQRRALRRSVLISRHCAWVDKTDGATAGWWTRQQFRWRASLVHGWHRFGRSWQAYYNAACFDAIRLERRWEARAGKAAPRALRNLNTAALRSAGALPYRWAAKDEDLAYFRGDRASTACRAEYEKVVERLRPLRPAPRRARLTSGEDPRNDMAWLRASSEDDPDALARAEARDEAAAAADARRWLAASRIALAPD